MTHSLLLAALLLMPVWLFGMQLYQSVNSAEQVRGVVEATNQS